MANTITSVELDQILQQASTHYAQVGDPDKSLLVVGKTLSKEALRSSLTTKDGRIVLCIKDVTLEPVTLEDGSTRLCLCLEQVRS